jgi:hypothetical protein
MASLPEGIKVLAVTPVNFEEIIDLSKTYRKEGAYTEDELRVIRSQARSKNNVAMVMFRDDTFWIKEENVGRAIHDTGDWRGDR